MSDLSQKSSGELVEKLQNLMPKLKSLSQGGLWAFSPTHDLATADILRHVANLVLAQQKEIEQLKAELKELRK